MLHVRVQFEVRDLSTVCALVPVALLCLLAVVPESPVFRLAEGNVAEARRSLRFYRGPRCDVDEELDAMRKSLVEVSVTDKSLGRTRTRVQQRRLSRVPQWFPNGPPGVGGYVHREIRGVDENAERRVRSFHDGDAVFLHESPTVISRRCVVFSANRSGEV